MSTLERIPFTLELIGDVQGFDCGSEVWSIPVNKWIKTSSGPDSVGEDMERGAAVWLYTTSDGDLVGFGSLSVAQQRFPGPKDVRVPASVILYMAVDRRFHSEPKGAVWHERYGHQILSDLIHLAGEAANERPLLTLYVDQENVKGIKFYTRAGFQKLHKPYLDQATNRLHDRMYMLLREVSGQLPTVIAYPN